MAREYPYAHTVSMKEYDTKFMTLLFLQNKKPQRASGTNQA